MKLEEHVKIDIIKAFTEILKARRGKGPQNIYIKQFKDEVNLISEGFLSQFEKYNIHTFGESQVEHFEYLLQEDVVNIERALQEKLKHKLKLTVDGLECDIHNDKMTYILRID